MRRLVLFCLSLMVYVTSGAQIRGNSVTVTVTPDHKDWNYRVGEQCGFIVNVLRSGTLIDNVKVDYEAGPEMYPEVKKKGVVLKDGTLTLKGKMEKPGFYRVDVKAYVDGKEYKGACSAAFSPEKLQPTTVMPKDFESPWKTWTMKTFWMPSTLHSWKPIPICSKKSNSSRA